MEKYDQFIGWRAPNEQGPSPYRLERATSGFLYSYSSEEMEDNYHYNQTELDEKKKESKNETYERVFFPVILKKTAKERNPILDDINGIINGKILSEKLMWLLTMYRYIDDEKKQG